jgi:pilus assembly protein CpaC
MTMFPINPLLKGKIMKTGFFAACLLAVSTVGQIAPNILSGPAAASDFEPVAEEADNSRFIRMGLNKSVVIRLPAEARDVVIGNETIVDAFVRSKNTAYLFGRNTGQTNIFFFDANGRQILSVDLEVAQDTMALKKLLRRTLPGNRITVDSVDNHIVLGGTARNAFEVKTAMDMANSYYGGSATTNTVINTIVVEGEDQVMLRVKVVEIQRDVLKQLGVNLSQVATSIGNLTFNFANFPTGLTNGLLSSASRADVGFSGGGVSIDGIIRAMESDGLVRTLAEPNLTALTGQSANFQAGGEFPFRSCNNDGECTVEFRNFGVIVDFTPTVLSENRIVLRIRTEVSDISGALNGIPTLDTRTATTSLELPSGGSMMLAGLIKETTRQNIDGTPGLKKLPILGQLFRSQDFISNETELVVLVTPILVRPTSPSKLTSPDKNFNPATDKEQIFMGRLNKIYGGAADAPDGNYHGSVGFIVE